MANDLRILILEDSKPDFELMALELRRAQVTFTARHVMTKADFLAELEAFAPDVVLTDYRLPGYDGLAALAAVRQRSPELPTILVSGQMGEEIAIEALKLGAADYVLKTNLARLAPALLRAVRERDEVRELRRTQEALRRAHDELEERVQARTAELVLANARLQEEKLEVQRLSQDLSHFGRVSLMGELAAALAHELRQPLTAVVSNAEAALELLGPGVIDLGELREILRDITAEGWRAGQVIQRLRSLLGKGQSERRPLDLNELIREVTPLVRGLALMQQVSLTLELAPALPPTGGDRIQLEQVLVNLVVNALDAMKTVPMGQRKLVVRSAQSEPHTLEVSVQDSGAGIAPDNIERVFESFFTTKADGMGMGLSICRSIAQGHGGRIWANNNPEGGATFHLALPAGLEAQP